PDAHRPSARSRRRLDERHVHAVDVRPLLTVDFDGHEMAVQDLRSLHAFEALMPHHMAPGARRVADGKKDRFVLTVRALERVRPPRVPVDGVVFVLEKIGSVLFGETIRQGQLWDQDPRDESFRIQTLRRSDSTLRKHYSGRSRSLVSITHGM